MAATPRLRTERNLLSYFHQALRDVSRNQGVAGSDATLHYLAHLLSDYAAADRLFDEDGEGRRLQPLALLYGQALEARSPRERQLLLRRLGDLALFVAGVFRGRLQRRLTDLDYCIGMGGSAYGYLHQLTGNAPGQQALRSVFGELAESFARWVGVLAELGPVRPGAAAHDPLRRYEQWLRTGEPGLARRLAELGITSWAAAGARRH